MTGLPRDTARSEAARAKDELAQAARHSRGLFGVAILFSIFVNLLMLTGPLYMLQIYDRVLGSQSEATLIALSGLVVFCFFAWGCSIMRGAAFWRASAQGCKRALISACSKRPSHAKPCSPVIPWPQARSAISRLWRGFGPRLSLPR